MKWQDLTKEELEAILPKEHEGYIYNRHECPRCLAIRAALKEKNRDLYLLRGWGVH